MYKKLLIALVFFVAGCAAKPILNIESRPIPLSAQTLPLAQIEDEIAQAAMARGWVVEKKSDGYLAASHGGSSYEAAIDIRFTQTAYSITYNSSRRMRESEGNIHYRYNRWISVLDQDIQLKLNQAGRKPSRTPAS